MKLSTFILSAMSVAILASCQEKSKNDVKPTKEQTTQSGGNNGGSGEQPGNGHDCPACGMG